MTETRRPGPLSQGQDDQANTATSAEAAGASGDSRGAAVAGELTGRQASLSGDAWRELRRNPIFLISVLLIAVLIAMAIVPGLFTRQDPQACTLARSLQPPGNGHLFGTDLQGCDLYTRTIFGARASVSVGFVTTVLVTLVGGAIGVVAGFRGGFSDTVLSRLADVFFGIPLLLGAIVILSIFTARNVLTVALALVFIGWPTLARVMRSSVIGTRDMDYVQAARALGAGPWRIVRQHILPNALAPVIVVSTINLGVYIAVEATLSYLGIGLGDSTISWGQMIADAQPRFLNAPGPLLFPALFLSITVLSFILLGDAVRDALDPKLR